MVVARVKAVGLVRVRAERLARVLVPKKAERKGSVESEPGRAWANEDDDCLIAV
jgi:hypothetical protein